jgi:hypothetical protein
MQRKTLMLLTAALVALAAVLAFGAGCGDDEPAAEPKAVVADLSADEIVAQGEKAMQDVTSAAFSAELSMAAEGDPEKVADPMTQQLLQSPISLSASGKSSDEPVAADLTMTVTLMGQPLELKMLADGDKAWVGYEEQWYKVPAKDSKKATDQLSEGSLPTDQLKAAGLDPGAWDLSWELVGVEDLAGTQAYHVRGTVDAGKFAQSLMDALNDPKLAEQLGGEAAEQLESATAGSGKELEELQNALEAVSVDAWYEAETFYLRKLEGKADFDMTSSEDAQGLTSVSLGMLVELGTFNEPVEVTPPETSKPLDELMEQMLGGMSLGMGDMTF